MVIFGASGDLTYRKLVPALYDLAQQRLLPAGFSVIGFARRDMDDQSFRDHLRGILFMTNRLEKCAHALGR